MNTRGRMGGVRRAWAVVAAVVMATVSASCGGSSATSGGGAGETNSLGCDDGDTRTCVGPGACEGGQLCSEGKWSRCDCGTGGQSPGAGAGGEPGMAAGASGAPSEGGATPGASNPGDAGAGGQGPKTFEDEPCDEAALGCFARPCDATDPGRMVCEALEYCAFFSRVRPTFVETEESVVFRLPRAADFGVQCSDCPDGSILSVEPGPKEADGRSFDVVDGHFTVNPPWYFGGCRGPRAQCIYQTYPRVRTDRKDAPAANVRYAPGPCPD